MPTISAFDKLKHNLNRLISTCESSDNEHVQALAQQLKAARDHHAAKLNLITMLAAIFDSSEVAVSVLPKAREFQLNHVAKNLRGTTFFKKPADKSLFKSAKSLLVAAIAQGADTTKITLTTITRDSRIGNRVAITIENNETKERKIFGTATAAATELAEFVRLIAPAAAPAPLAYADAGAAASDGSDAAAAASKPGVVALAVATAAKAEATESKGAASGAGGTAPSSTAAMSAALASKPMPGRPPKLNLSGTIHADAGFPPLELTSALDAAVEFEVKEVAKEETRERSSTAGVSAAIAADEAMNADDADAAAAEGSMASSAASGAAAEGSHAAVLPETYARALSGIRGAADSYSKEAHRKIATALVKICEASQPGNEALMVGALKALVADFSKSYQYIGGWSRALTLGLTGFGSTLYDAIKPEIDAAEAAIPAGQERHTELFANSDIIASIKEGKIPVAVTVESSGEFTITFNDESEANFNPTTNALTFAAMGGGLKAS